jgi:hypothetical protein
MDFQNLLKSLTDLKQKIAGTDLQDSQAFQLQGFIIDFVQAAKIDLTGLLLTDLVDLPQYAKDTVKVKKRLEGLEPEYQDGYIITDGKILMRICDGLEIKGFRKSTQIWNDNIKIWYDIVEMTEPNIINEIIFPSDKKKNKLLKLKPRAATLFINRLLETTEKDYAGSPLTDSDKQLALLDLPTPTEIRRIASYVLSMTGYDAQSINDELKKAEEEVNAIKQAKALAKAKYNYKCVITDKKVANLEAHHLFPQDTYPHLSTNLENLIPINQTLHRAYHKWARENNKGRKGLGDYDSFWIFVEQYYKNKIIRNNIQEVKKKFPALQ